METTEALRRMADHVAQQLVAQALERLTREDVVITVHAQPVRKQLPPAKRRGRRPGVKLGRPAKRKKGWTPEHRAAFAAAMARKRKERGKRATPSVAAGSCWRCDHPVDQHPAGGACNVRGCICESLHQ